MFQRLDEWPPSDPDRLSASAATVGSFDGVHLGHQKVVGATVEQARRSGGQSLIVTFANHPLHYLRPEAGVRLLTLAGEKQRLLRAEGCDLLLMFPFGEQFSQLTATEFIGALREYFGIERFVIGYDSVVGSDRVHEPEELERICAEHGVQLHRVGAVQAESVTVSSSTLRDDLLVDRLDRFPEFTGRYYSHTGTVRRGRGRGETRLDYPTLNLPIPPVKLMPGDGVYAGRVYTDGELWPAAVNLMVPKFGLSEDERQELIRLSIEGGPSEGPRLLEAYVIDDEFGGDHYGEEVRVELVKKIREELPFEGWDKLREQIDEDVKKVKKVLEEKPVLEPSKVSTE